MPFRRTIKKAFGLSESRSSLSSQHETIAGRKGSCYYQPGERVPVPKYRGVVDPKHKAQLENFTFEVSDWRRRSTNSLYSPMGSKIPSRNGSIKTPYKAFKLNNSHFGQVQEGSDASDDVTNVGGTRSHSVEDSEPTTEHNEFMTSSGTATDHTPFTEADFSHALEKSNTRITVPE